MPYVASTVKFDDQAGLVAIVISDVWTDGMLASEFQAPKPVISKLAPEQAFGKGHFLTEFSAPVYHPLRSWLALAVRHAIPLFSIFPSPRLSLTRACPHPALKGHPPPWGEGFPRATPPPLGEAPALAGVRAAAHWLPATGYWLLATVSSPPPARPVSGPSDP